MTHTRHGFAVPPSPFAVPGSRFARQSGLASCRPLHSLRLRCFRHRRRSGSRPRERVLAEGLNAFPAGVDERCSPLRPPLSFRGGRRPTWESALPAMQSIARLYEPQGVTDCHGATRLAMTKRYDGAALAAGLKPCPTAAGDSIFVQTLLAGRWMPGNGTVGDGSIRFAGRISKDAERINACPTGGRTSDARPYDLLCHSEEVEDRRGNPRFLRCKASRGSMSRKGLRIATALRASQ